MHRHGSGVLAATLVGFLSGVMLLAIGQLLFANLRSPLARLTLAALFAIPAGIAGYHAVYGIGQLAIDPGATLSILSWIGAVFIAWTAGTRLAGGPAVASSSTTSPRVDLTRHRHDGEQGL